MEFLRRIGAEAFNRAYLWALGFLLFTAITGVMGWRGTFHEKANVEGPRAAKAEATAPARKKPVTRADWP